MKHIVLFFTVLFLPFATLMSQQPFAPAEERNALSFSSPGAFRFGLYGYDNPAILTYVHQPDLFSRGGIKQEHGKTFPDGDFLLPYLMSDLEWCRNTSHEGTLRSIVLREQWVIAH